jgi:hypothetical protein
MQNPLLRDALHPRYRPSPPAALPALQVPKRHSKCIRRADASAANASGSLQTALSKVTRQPNFPPISGSLRRVTSDRVLTSFVQNPVFRAALMKTSVRCACREPQGYG